MEQLQRRGDYPADGFCVLDVMSAAIPTPPSAHPPPFGTEAADILALFGDDPSPSLIYMQESLALEPIN